MARAFAGEVYVLAAAPHGHLSTTGSLRRLKRNQLSIVAKLWLWDGSRHPMQRHKPFAHPRLGPFFWEREALELVKNPTRETPRGSAFVVYEIQPLARWNAAVIK